MTNPVPLLLYIHGFNSSASSVKGRQLQQDLEQRAFDCELWLPDLPHWPAEAVKLMFTRLRPLVGQRPLALIGSSLGGYYGTWLRERLLAEAAPGTRIPLVLINPGVRPFEYWESYLGEQQNLYTGERYELTMDHIRQLALLDVEGPSAPDDCLLLVQTGDETLDYRRAVKRYAGCRQRVEEGGSHGFDGFEATLPEIYRFFHFTDAK
ncbi:YqiA/YcfP family alpha/beta fold hydrolase [Aestuariirhabdus litorea]|uniref:Esterase n=1 Tax=Aestuariirhabdus litorea TaxID=2528527 RepID=A0A3P3VKS5_9GAMM|nr:YqiA/YcfP family alpha/beta fold hydrolase [Aestuariirhabdus litorea]RRJ82336.1 esterase [Aestuariirhabdus litorea]RWW92501.1 esterase [Endozoicomonadaceae bacterium GTF-13]